MAKSKFQPDWFQEYFSSEKSKTKTTTTDYSTPIEIEYVKDITHLAYNNKTPTIIGRNKEINHLVNTLCKKNKNNAVLIGEPGVGKTSIIYALAEQIVKNNIHPNLKNCHILDLDITSLVSGCKYRGDFEAKIQKIFDDISEKSQDGQKLIICIDEIHTIVGAGSAEGSLDLATILKPFLQEEAITIIGTSTFQNYKIIEKDKSLSRRFDTIQIPEASHKETFRILFGLKSSYEKYHKVVIPDDLIDEFINLSERYIPHCYLPDKALNLLDDTCAIKSNSLYMKNDGNNRLTIEDICIAISLTQEIPISNVKQTFDLCNLEDNLNSKVIGQSHATAIIANSIRRMKAGLNDENRPLASFMFIGPTGVGKTETAKTLADLVFSGKDNMIRFDMSEYMEEHSVSKLIGSPPGYAGHDESGLLTEQVRIHPYSLVLFDEFEKSHPRIYNILLQILDEGCLTDSSGRHINFKNTIIILTSNVGASELCKNSVGFGENDTIKSQNIMTEVKRTFSPEFLNRIDDIIQFNQLSKEDILKIAKIHISNLINKVKARQIDITISDDVIYKVAELGYTKEYGARELRRTIIKEISNPLAMFILENKVDDISVTLNNGIIKISEQRVIAHV